MQKKKTGASNFRNTVEKVIPFHIRGDKLGEFKRLAEKFLSGTQQSWVGFKLSSLNSKLWTLQLS